MNKIIKLILGVAIVGGLAFFAYDLLSNKGSSLETELIDFAIKDVETVDRVILSNDYGYTFEIVKQSDGTWTDKDGGCIVPESVDFILDAFKNIEFKSYLTEGAAKNHLNQMQSKHTKVEIYSDGNWVKTWFIGPPMKDHYGQIMLLDSDEYGKSDKPVVMHIKGVHGIIGPRFFADPRKWECTNVFALDINEIKSVNVKFNDEPARSFKVAKEGNGYNVYQQDQLLSGVDTTYIFSYLQKFKKIHFDIPNYSLTNKEVDSLKQTTPFCVLDLKETNGDQSTLRMWHIPTLEDNFNEFGVAVKHDTGKFWCELPSGELVKCQFFAFNPILLGHIYFPMDMSNVNTGDYQPKDPSKYSH